MKSIKTTYLFIATILVLAGCKKTQPEYILPQETQDFFVNYDVGTCWVYQDTLQQNRYDTIELVSKKPISTYAENDLLSSGYTLHFKPKKMQEFDLEAETGNNKSTEIHIYPAIRNRGDMEFGNTNNIWAGNFYHDSLMVGKKMYYNVLRIQESCDAFSYFTFSKNIGLVSYASSGVPGEKGGIYVLVRTFKK